MQDIKHQSKMIVKSLVEKSFFDKSQISFDGPTDEASEIRAELVFVELSNEAHNLIVDLREIGQWLGVNLAQINVKALPNNTIRAEISLGSVVPFFTV